jgi:hypothetical protein
MELGGEQGSGMDSPPLELRAVFQKIAQVLRVVAAVANDGGRQKDKMR